MILPSKELLSAVFAFEVTPATGKELLEHSFGYAQGIRTACARPLKSNEWICVHDNELTFCFIDTRPEVLKNIPDGVYTSRTINIYELAHKCKEWAKNENYYLLSGIYTYNGKTDLTYDCLVNQNFSYEDDGEFIKRDESCSEVFNGFTSEPEAIFKACEWVLQQLMEKQ